MTASIHNLHTTTTPKPMIDATFCIELRSVYGKWTMYPSNEVARDFAEVANTKTLTPATVRIAKRMGFNVIVESGGSGRAAQILEDIAPRLSSVLS